MKRLLLSLLPFAFLGSASALAAPLDPSSPDGVAQDDSGEGEEEEDEEDRAGDVLDEILSEQPMETPSEELESLRDTTDVIGIPSEVVVPEKEQGKRVIKTIQKKPFLKLGRFEVLPNVAFVTSDPFLNRYIVGVGLGYHLTEIFETEVNLGFSPILGEADWKPLTKQLIENNHISPDLSPLTYFGNATFLFSPIYGKVALTNGRIVPFDIFGAFGMGVVRTSDDLEALQQEGEDPALATANQIHPTTNFGGGLRIVLGDSMAVRIEGRSLVYIETVSSTTLEMKNNFILSGGVSFFFPNVQQ
ncbi:MAG: outer membrane beta-barrel domain-containing protein [Deltaproteobacteria bacterium]|nr:outer membrane beta-barrel domain-containing protein [Deltaproteobacteria bacterium]